MRRAILALGAAIGFAAAAPASAQEAIGAHLGRAPVATALTSSRRDLVLDKLVAAYPDVLARHDADVLVWRDGTRMPTNDGKTTKTPSELVSAPDILDMFVWRYPLADQPLTPTTADPGRARPAAFFGK